MKATVKTISLKMIIVFSVAATLAMARNATAVDVYQSGADRLTTLQNNDGGWDWPLNDLNPASVSPPNTVGPIGMGLAAAYSHTGDASHLVALTKAGGLLMSKTNNFSPSDGYLAKQLDGIFGGSTYSNYVMTNYYDKLAAGTYMRANDPTLYTTASYVQAIRDSRSGSQANMAAWDIGTGLYAAQAIGAPTSDWTAGLEAEVNELNGNQYYDVLGLAGAVLGLASVHETAFDPTSGEHATAGSLQDLGDILATYQISSGGFAWNKNYVIPNDNDEAVQETSYAVLALNDLDPTRYASQIALAGGYLKSAQLGTGGWENYVGSSEGENNEITGEALWASNAVPEPSTLVLLGMGGLTALAYGWRRRRI